MPISPTRTEVAVLGGGIGGLTAAQELAERGFAVTVYEARAEAGGKSRSAVLPGTGQGGRRDLPCEHGFRFFPGWYKHLTDTMERIPFRNQPRGVADNLVHARHTMGLTMARGSWRMPANVPNTGADLAAAFDMLLGVLTDGHVRVPRSESWHYVDRVLSVLTTCEERLFDEYENTSWWEFVGASSRSPEFQRYLVSGLTKNLVACRAQELSARTVAIYLNHLFFDLTRDGADRLLNGPTNDVFIHPWIAHLERLGVRFVTGSRVEEIRVDGGRVADVRVRRAGGLESVAADFYVCALPCEVMARLCSPSLVAAAPSLAGVGRLRTDWMNGAQFYLDREVYIAPGHTILLDAPWSITSVSQGQFWPQHPLAGFGDGRVRTILSLDISDWNTPGILFGKPARHCTKEEIRAEVWAQVAAHLPGPEGRELREARVLDFYLDEAVEFLAPDRPVNHEPLLINTVGSWALRPDAVTEIPNLFLAADYVRTHTDVATMEAANEAGRRAVNGILLATSTNAAPCAIHPPEVPAFAVSLRAWDKLRYRNGLPHRLPAPLQATDSLLLLADRGLRALGAAADRAASEPQGLDAQVVDLDWKVSAVMTSVRYGIEKAIELFERRPAPPAAGRPQRDAPGLRVLEEVSRRNGLPALERDLRGMRSLVEGGLVRLDEAFVDLARDTPDGRIRDVVAGILDLPGKRNRALAAYVAAWRGRGALIPAVHNVALAVELVHAATLLHDDVVDMADVRRGFPAPRVTFGNAASILGGDELFVRAVENVTAIGRPDLVDSLMAAMRAMLSAEASQLDHRGRLVLDPDRCLEINRGKTALLFRWASASGALVAGHSDERVRASGDWGEHFGMAYQLVDDVLDLAGDPSAMGKTLFTDLAEGKLTYPVVVAAVADDALRGLLEGMVDDPDRARTPEWVADVRARVLGGGGIEAAKRCAHHHAQEAGAAIACLPADAARAAFEGLMELSLERAG